MAKGITVKSCMHVYGNEVDPSQTKPGADVWEGLVNMCAAAAQNALEIPPAGYTPTQRNSLTDLFTSLKATHRGIRVLLKLGDTKPESLDSLVLARLQLEALYDVCLLVEGPQHVDRFVRDAFKRQYVRYMLYREETKHLSKFDQSNADERARLNVMMAIWNITEGQRLTIEYHELEQKPPAGFQVETIEQFPTPGKLIRDIQAGPKRKMLERLYPEYQELCVYAHGRAAAGFGKNIFDERSPIRQMMGEAQVHEMFQRSVLAPAQVYSLLSVAQAAAELTILYPHDIELAKVSSQAWNELHNANIVTTAVWNIRTKALFGIVS
jgi:hypothetical protein